MSIEWCHKMTQITMSWFMASWIYGQNDRARRRWSGRLEQSGDADLGPTWSTWMSPEHQYIACWPWNSWDAPGKSMKIHRCQCQRKDLHAMLPNSSTLYDGCASGIVGFYFQWKRTGFGACSHKTLDAYRRHFFLMIICEFELEISNDKDPKTFCRRMNGIVQALRLGTCLWILTLGEIVWICLNDLSGEFTLQIMQIWAAIGHWRCLARPAVARRRFCLALPARWEGTGQERTPVGVILQTKHRSS